MNLRLRRVLLELALLATLAMSGCASPKILAFAANPQRICQDQTATLSWSVKGTAVLEAEPPVAGVGAVAAADSLEVSAGETTVFTLRVTRNDKMAFARQEVVVYQTDAVVPIVIATEPADGGGLEATVEAPVRDWDAALRIATVANTSDRPVTIEHGGRQVTLAAGEESAALADVVVSGTWTLRAELLPGEIIGDPAHAPAEMLRVAVTLTCAR